jgi:hypothetical protein
MTTIRRASALLLPMLLASCNTLDVPDLNNPGIESLENNPTRVAIANAATGLLVGGRGGPGGYSSSNGYVMVLAVFGREAYNFDTADPRNVTELLVGPLDGGSPAFGGNLFAIPYANIRNSNVLIHAVNKILTDPNSTVGLSAAEKNATLGYAMTMQSLEFLGLINTRDANGIPVDVDITPTGPVAPILAKAAVLVHIDSLLDSARTLLLAGGSSFPFPLSSGYTGFNTPSTFAQFNRALRARVAIYQNDFAGAITALTTSFMDTTHAFSVGVYHVFTTTSGDVTNGLYDPSHSKVYAHPRLVPDAQLQPGGAPDQRVIDKVDSILTAKTVQGLSSKYFFKLYNSSSAPIPIIRNEELILIRAEAELGLGNLGTAATFLDEVRVKAGGLAPYAGPLTAPALTDELLYNRRYSLLFEGGHRWIDVRRFGRLTTDLPQDPTTVGGNLPTVRFSKMPFPSNECLARSPQPTQGCTPEDGS